MSYFFCVLIGYFFGCISPSYIIGKLKRTDLRRLGTKNLGASNAFLQLGRAAGAFVMLFDIFKSLFAVILCGALFSELELSGLVAGSACVLGHNYPFYLGFKGGKGLASYAGLVLGISPPLFLLLLTLCLIVAFVFNYGCFVALSAAIILRSRFHCLCWAIYASCRAISFC